MNPPQPVSRPEPGRAASRIAFARAASGDAHASVEAASGDASTRSYWRVRSSGGDAVLMDAGDLPEVIDPWLDVAARLRAAGLNAPQVLAEDRAQGYLLLSDLGTRLYLPELTGTTADALYADAMDALLAMQTRVDPAGLPQYGEMLLTEELELLPAWFLQRHLGIAIACEEWDIVEAAFRLLINNALQQPKTFVHRDFHSRNLLVGAGHHPGIVDFQDAVLGPVTYDLVSLLRDCYIAWDGLRVRGWAERYRQRMRNAGVLDQRVNAARWQRWFDLMGLQRHLKVLGIFCRLWYRDGKRGYLGDLPRVWRYVQQVASGYPELGDFLALLARWVGERDLTSIASEGTHAQ